jgi:hypothetical protein
MEGKSIDLSLTKKTFFLTIDLVQDLLDLLLAPIAVDVNFQHAGLWTSRWGEKRGNVSRHAG